MNSILISVVLPVYNGEKYLVESIESILNQTYKNFELIIINDGSIDGSLSIIKNYEKLDKRIVLITRENKGLITSLNEGISKAKGKYIVRMDQDDISFINRLEVQVTFMENNISIGVCGSSIIGFGEKIKKRVSTYSTRDSTLKVELLFSSVFAHPSIIMRRDIISDYNLEYKEEFKHAEDFEFWTTLAEYTSFSNIKKPLLKYRILGDSTTRKADRDLENRYNILKLIFTKYLKKLEIKNNESENRLHFNLTVNTRIRDAKIDFITLEKYFNKIESANIKKNLFDPIELKKVLGKKWIWNLYYTKKLKGIFSSYFIFGMWSILSK